MDRADADLTPTATPQGSQGSIPNKRSFRPKRRHRGFFCTWEKKESKMDSTGTIEASSAPKEWPPRPAVFSELLTPVEAAQYLRLDQTGRHRPKDAIRTMTYWRDRGDLRATKYARLVWFRRAE